MRGAAGLLERAKWWRAILEFSPPILRNRGRLEQAWTTWREHPGAIISDAQRGVVVENDAGLLGSVLPSDPPTFECDILIGRGPRKE